MTLAGFRPSVAGLMFCWLPVFTGCGASTPSVSCSYAYNVVVSPVNGSADHMALAPGNQIQFEGVGYGTASPSSCPAPTDLRRLEYAAWLNPDTADIQISSANDATNGTAICLNATKGAVTLTGTFAPITATGPAGSGTDTSVKSVTLTCQ